jgi:hypothetical protein
MNWQQILAAYEQNRGVLAKVFRADKPSEGHFSGVQQVVMVGNVLFSDDLTTRPYMHGRPLVEIVYWNDEYRAIPSFAGIRLPYVAQQQRAQDWSWKGNFIFVNDESYPFAHPIKLHEEWSNPFRPDPFMLLEIMRLEDADFSACHFTRMQLYRYYLNHCQQYDPQNTTVWRIRSDFDELMSGRSHSIHKLVRSSSTHCRISLRTANLLVSAVSTSPRAAYQEAYNRAFRGF